MTSATNPQTTETRKSVWKVDATHSRVEFSAKHMMFTTVKGHFAQFDAEIDWNEEDLTKSSVAAHIDSNSLFTGEAKRDGHLPPRTSSTWRTTRR